MPSVQTPQSIPICRAGCIKTATSSLPIRVYSAYLARDREIEKEKERKEGKEFESEVSSSSSCPTLSTFCLLLAKQRATNQFLSRDRSFPLERLDDIAAVYTRLVVQLSFSFLFWTTERKRKNKREREKTTWPGV